MAEAQPLTQGSLKFKRKVRTSTQTVIGSRIYIYKRNPIEFFKDVQIASSEG